MSEPTKNPKTKCTNCRDGYAYDATVNRAVTVLTHGSPRVIQIADLPVLLCDNCGSVYFDNRTDSQIESAAQAEIAAWSAAIQPMNWTRRTALEMNEVRAVQLVPASSCPPVGDTPPASGPNKNYALAA
ncbi:MAG: hypothetical protein ACKVZJ_14830 [Phycisphaerales bacterium]